MHLKLILEFTTVGKELFIIAIPTHPCWLEGVTICKITKGSGIFKCREKHSCALVVLNAVFNS